jgi:hypothetical protein
MFPSWSIELTTTLTFIFYIMTALYAIFSVILYFHWMEYAVDNRIRNLSLLLYFLSTLPLVATMGLVILYV